MKRTPGFTADDGTWFATAAECKAYEERGSLIDLLSDLQITRVEAALDRTDARLSDAFERAGAIIAAKRRASGDLKRAAKKPEGAAFENVEKAMRDAKK